MTTLTAEQQAFLSLYEKENAGEEIRKFLTNNPDFCVDFQNKDGNSPLQLSTDRWDEETVYALTRQGADPFIKNNYGCTARDMLDLNYAMCSDVTWEIEKKYINMSACLKNAEVRFHQKDKNKKKEDQKCLFEMTAVGMLWSVLSSRFRGKDKHSLLAAQSAKNRSRTIE